MEQRVFFHEMKIAELANRTKTIRVILPVGYDKHSGNYPVIYMHDGQNLLDESPFSGYSWDVIRTMDRMVNTTEIKPAIIVGIDNDSERRIMEYTSVFNPGASKRVEREFGLKNVVAEGDCYMRFIVNQLKPFIDEKYRTLPGRNFTAVAGSSCGGNISLLLGLVHPEVFGVVGAFSPAYQLIKKHLFALLETFAYQNGTRIYHDMGAHESRFFPQHDVWQAKTFQRKLRKLGFSSESILCVIDKEGRHTELFWQDRFSLFLRFFLAEKS